MWSHLKLNPQPLAHGTPWRRMEIEMVNRIFTLPLSYVNFFCLLLWASKFMFFLWFFLGIEATPKDRLAVTRFLNTSDVEPVKLSSPVIRQRANTTGVARTVTQSTDPSVKPQEQSLTDLSTSEKYSSMSLPSSACSSVKKRHVAEILKQSQKMDVIPGTLAKLKETIKKQKENRWNTRINTILIPS